VKRSKFLTGAARPILDRWFESEQLKATIATDAINRAFAAPSMPGTAYVLFHHVMVRPTATRASGATRAAAWAAFRRLWPRPPKDMGVDIRTEAEVGRILVKDGVATGVALANGNEYQPRKQWASNLDPNWTFQKLMDPRFCHRFAEAVPEHRLRQRHRSRST